jgi:nicotinate-nucleotide adenylyltransferase
VARLGILGGTFNPPHLGHLAIARHAREELDLERVLLIPANAAPHKPGDDCPAHHRLRMCELLVVGTDGIVVCALEIDRGGTSYTVDTLAHIHGSAPDAELTFIVGADTARTLAAWREPAKLLELADLAVAARSGSARREVLEAVERVVGDADAGRSAVARMRFLEMPVIEISSSQVRARAARSEPVDELVGPAVAAYIAEHQLYRPAIEARS